jgi:xanthine dehydrogenase accessory factor
MNTNEYVASVICELLENGSPLVLVSIVSSQGSSPRHQGTKMVVGPDGKSYGTIGGSLLEHTAIREANQVLIERRSKFMDFDLAGSGTLSGGMICGGKVEVLLDYIPATRENVEFFRCWHEAVSSGDNFYFLTQVRDSHDGINISGHSLLSPDGKVLGHFPLTVSQLENLKAELRHISVTTVVPMEDTRVIVDPIHNLKTLYCFGSGHVAVPTVHIAAMVGFRVVVIDDRAEFANAERFPNADQICVIEDFNRAPEGLEIEKDSFIIILTREHQYDRVVLEQALKTEAYYIGMISSREKRDAVFQLLLKQGVGKQELERVHSPIGIDIGSETPEEIAVSIVAQLIEERARQSA